MLKNPSLLVREFDENFNLFHELMPHKVHEILLVSTPYDAFVLEEDGSLAFRIINEYHGLNLSTPPRLTHVSKATDALELLHSQSFDLVLTMPFVGEMDAFALGKAIKKVKPRLPVIMLTANMHSIEHISADVDQSGIDRMYVWTGDANLLLAIIKNVEDHANVKNDTRLAMVRVIILIEDSPFCLSSFLPLLYREVVGQTQSVLDESLNDEHRLLKLRARPKILVASCYEDAMKIFKRYSDYVFCVMSDTRFYRNGVLDDNAGVRFLKYISRKEPDMPLLLMSTEKINKSKAEKIPAVFIDKNHQGLLQEIEQFFLVHLGFGDFVFRLPDGTEVDRVENFQAFEAKISHIPEKSLVYHAERNHISNWIMARSEIGLATMLSKLKISDFASIEAMREYLGDCIHGFRKWRQLGVITAFSESDFDPLTVDFVKIGKGSLGGKARGIAFLASLLRERQDLREKYSDNSIKVPKTCVIANDGFISFIEENRLYYLCGGRDEIIAKRFLAAPLPDWLRNDLSAFLLKVTCPLAVRSSSMLEDMQFRPYAGLYKTYMLPNNNPDFQVRFAQLENAIKLVYASTYYEEPRSFSKSIGQNRQDSMAVIIQQLIGRDYDGYFYPACSGVALSYNFYPISYMKQEDGIVSLALGFGKTVVEGELCLRFSPKHPKILPQLSTVDDILDNTQRLFYVLDMALGKERCGFVDDCLISLEVADAPETYPIVRFCSTYIEDEHRIRDTITHGSRVVTFAHMLKYKNYPIPEIITDILALGESGMGCPVEVEFAVDLNENDGEAIFFLLQIRPLAIGYERQDVVIHDGEREAAFCRTIHALGHKRDTSLADIIVVKEEGFSFHKSKIIAQEISVINAKLVKEGRKYLLIGPGRWGSADKLLGIPVQWHDIGGVGAMVELVDERAIEPSQGTHFFQNITSLGIPYLTIKRDDQSSVDWQWLHGQNVAEETEHLFHIQLPTPFTVVVNGKTSESVMYAQPL